MIIGFHSFRNATRQVSRMWERDVAPWLERSLMARSVDLHGGPTGLFLVPASAPRLV